jgi:hypothetical protein
VAGDAGRGAAELERAADDAGRVAAELVADWLTPRIGQVCGVTLREAVKPLPPETARRLLAARTAGKQTAMGTKGQRPARRRP